MSRTGRSSADDSGWYDEVAPPPAGARAVRSAGVSAWAGGGLTLAAMVVLGLVVVARAPDEEQAHGRFHRGPSAMGSLAFSPDGRTLALGRSDGGLMLESLYGGRDRQLEAGPGLGTLARGLAYSPDGKTLASGGLGSSVKLWDVATATLRGSIDGHSAPVASLAFSPDGKSLASGSLDGSVKVWDLDDGREITRIAGHTRDVRGLAFSPDGKSLASGSLDGSVKVWDLGTGREVAGLSGGGRRVYGVAFAPDGKTLALGLGASYEEVKGEVLLWTPADARQPFRVLGRASFASVAFSPDGKTLAAAGGDRVVKLWDVATGNEIASLPGHEGTISSLAFSPDGQALATAGLDSLVGLFELDPVKLKPTGHHHL